MAPLLLAAALCLAIFSLRDSWERTTLAAAVAGLTVFCGVGIYTTEAHPEYPRAFAEFSIALCASFVLTAIARRRLTPTRGDAPAWILPLESRYVALVVVLAYICARSVALVIPDVRVANLWSPPAVDLAASFAARLNQEAPRGGAITRYGATLLFPFYLIGLARFRNSFPLFAALVLTPPWIQFAADAYISRGELALPALLLIGNAWLTFPRIRMPLLVGLTAAAPVALIALARYAATRLGQDPSSIDVSQAFRMVLSYETSLPGYSFAVFDEQQRANLANYMRWLLTLPVPKALFLTPAEFRLNHEIAELVLGVGVQDASFFVFLTGIVTESVYLFGNGWGALHGIMVGAVLAVYSGVGPKRPSLDFLRLYFVYAAGYLFPRGGVASAMPPLVNGMLGLLAVILIATLLARPAALETGSRNSLPRGLVE